MSSNNASELSFDVVICGGGLAGLTLARQLRRETPQLKIAVVERQKRPLSDACHKVGESSVELSSHYFGEHLGLGDYLRKNHFVKNGLRFFPGGGATHELWERTEIGPPEMPKVPSFQLDRGRLESDLREMNEADGVVLFEGYKVDAIEFAKERTASAEKAAIENHLIRIRTLNGETHLNLEARWVVDAAGRSGLIRKKENLNTPSGHNANAAWWRVKGKVDVADMVPATETSWHGKDPDKIRWYSTVHFMGTGYWFWYIPLATGYTSLGLVVHDSEHPFENIATLERCKAWLAKHEPKVLAHIEALPALDFLCLRSYSYASERCMSGDRWTCVGEAGVFADPFYSPGSDFIALSNTLTTELIKRDFRNLEAGTVIEDISALAEDYNQFYLRFFDVATETYRKSAAVYGSPAALSAKVYWDNFNYWSFVCQYFFQKIYLLPRVEHQRFIDLANRFATLNFKAQKMLSEWAKRADNTPTGAHIYLPPIPSILANLHLDLEKQMSAEETFEYMSEKVLLAEEVLSEIALRMLQSLSESDARAIASEVDLNTLAKHWTSERLELQQSEGGTRRRGLSPIARDVERCLGRVQTHPNSNWTSYGSKRMGGDEAGSAAMNDSFAE